MRFEYTTRTPWPTRASSWPAPIAAIRSRANARPRRPREAPAPTCTTAAPGTRSRGTPASACRKLISTARCWPSSTACGSKTNLFETGSAPCSRRRRETRRPSRSRSGRSFSGRRRCWWASRTGCSTCGWPTTSTSRPTPARARSYATAWPRSSSRSTRWTARPMKRRSWRPRCLNSRKPFGRSGLAPITTPSGESWKSCVWTAGSTAQLSFRKW